jgi:hypothetical protein
MGGAAVLFGTADEEHAVDGDILRALCAHNECAVQQ